MTFKLSQRSIKALEGVHPKLIEVVELALKLSPVDFMVIEGVRTPQRQIELYAQGRTKPGKIVTWTLQSKHFPSKLTGYGHAVDLLPAPYDWKEAKPFDLMAKAMFEASKKLDVPIRWGKDWDKDGINGEKGETDSPHFELA